MTQAINAALLAITMGIVGTVYAVRGEVPAELWGLAWTVVGGYFGASVPAHRIEPRLPEPPASPDQPLTGARHAADQ